MFPSTSAEGGRDPWVGEERPEVGAPDEQPEPVPIRRLLSLAIAGFAGLLMIGLIFGAQTAGPGPARFP